MNKNLMRQAQQLQARLAKVQEELESETVEATSGGGVVKVVINGKLKVLSVKISPEAVKAEEVDLLEDLVMAAVNEAVDKAQEMASRRLSAVAGGLKFPGM